MKKSEKIGILNAPSLWYWSGCGGIEFKRFDYGINDYAVFVAGAWTSKPSVHSAKIRYHLKSGDAYILYNGYVVNFSDTVRAGL
jgi:hypothetical protein